MVAALRDLTLFVSGIFGILWCTFVIGNYGGILLCAGMVAIPLFLQSDKDDMGAIPRAPLGGYPCRHAHIVPVTLTLTGELVANICLDCDRQLAAEWNPRYPMERPPALQPERR